MSDEYADIYYVDTTRNADRTHFAPGNMTQAFRPMPQPQGAIAPPARTVYLTPPPQPMQYYYPPAQPAQPQSVLANLFGNMHAGQVIAMLAEALAAFRALPAAPAPTRDVTTDVTNGVVYETALARHAKTDEQIRTAGHILGRLIR